MYGSNQYGTITYATESIINSDEIKKYLVDLNPYVPPYLYTKFDQSFQEVQIQYDAQSLQLGLLNYKIQDLLKQAFINIATWGLDLWEEEYGITTNKFLTYEDRREIVDARKRGRGTTTISMIKNTVKAFTNGECEVIPHNDEYYFVIRFISIKGIPRNMQALIDTIEIIKPAHLRYRLEFKYNTWGMAKDSKMPWDEAKNTNTWESIRTMDFPQ